MAHPGEHRPPATPPAGQGRTGLGPARLRPRTLTVALAEAMAIGLLAAVAWSLIKGILEFPGVLAVAVIAGWAIGAVLWQVRANPLLAALVAGGAWLVGLVFSWLVAMAMLPGSSRTFLERVEATPFLEWQAPQFGAVEVLGLMLYLAAALYGARLRSA